MQLIRCSGPTFVQSLGSGTGDLDIDIGCHSSWVFSEFDRSFDFDERGHYRNVLRKEPKRGSHRMGTCRLMKVSPRR